MRSLAFARVCIDSRNEVGPNLWTNYPGVTVNGRIPRQERRKWERPTPLPASWGERRPAAKIPQLAASAQSPHFDQSLVRAIATRWPCPPFSDIGMSLLRPVHRARRAVRQTRMKPFLVVVAEVRCQMRLRLPGCLVSLDLHFLVLHGPP